MIYVLDHHYAVDHPDYCIVIESTRSVQEIIEILGEKLLAGIER